MLPRKPSHENQIQGYRGREMGFLLEFWRKVNAELLSVALRASKRTELMRLSASISKTSSVSFDGENKSLWAEAKS